MGFTEASEAARRKQNRRVTLFLCGVGAALFASMMMLVYASNRFDVCLFPPPDSALLQKLFFCPE